MSDSTFYGYIALLFVSGVLLTVFAAGGFGLSKGSRIVDGLFAAAFLIYSAYLLLFFDGGRVVISFYAFVVPVIAVVQLFKVRKARSEAAAVMPPAPADPPAYQQS